MRPIVLILASLTISGCQQVRGQTDPLPPPEAYERFEDKLAVTMLHMGVPWTFPCQDPGRCLKYDGPKRMTGLWRNEFEGSRFCPHPVLRCDSDGRNDPIWLDFAISLPEKFKDDDPGLYAIDFIGRASSYPGAYGHFGMFDKEVIVDRLIAIEQIEAAPAPPTEAELTEEWKHCETAGNCIPRSDLPDLYGDQKQ